MCDLRIECDLGWHCHAEGRMEEKYESLQPRQPVSTRLLESLAIQPTMLRYGARRSRIFRSTVVLRIFPRTAGNRSFEALKILEN